MFNGYKPDWTPLEIEIELYDIETKVKTSAGRKGVIIDYRIFSEEQIEYLVEFNNGTRSYWEKQNLYGIVY